MVTHKPEKFHLGRPSEISVVRIGLIEESMKNRAIIKAKPDLFIDPMEQPVNQFE